MKAIVGKRYRHYKGNEYTVLAIARHEDSPEKVSVVYRAEYDSPDFGFGCVWIRVIESFEGKVIGTDGTEAERFTCIDDMVI